MALDRCAARLQAASAPRRRRRAGPRAAKSLSASGAYGPGLTSKRAVSPASETTVCQTRPGSSAAHTAPGREDRRLEYRADVVEGQETCPAGDDEEQLETVSFVPVRADVGSGLEDVEHPLDGIVQRRVHVEVRALPWRGRGVGAGIRESGRVEQLQAPRRHHPGYFPQMYSVSLRISNSWLRLAQRTRSPIEINPSSWPSFGHREVAAPALGHDRHRLGRRARRLDVDDLARHDLADCCRRWVQSGEDDRIHQVPLGEHPDRLPRVAHQEGADPLRTHLLHGLEDGVARRGPVNLRPLLLENVSYGVHWSPPRRYRSQD